ncbi:sigma-70 family RNA polymerase sigma factor [soil metagenome]
MDDALTRDVVRGLREGSPDAWRTLYDMFAHRVWCSVAPRLGYRPADIADVVQETMLAAARSARQFDETKGTLWQWLWGIARIQLALHYRKQQRHDRCQNTAWIAANQDRLSRWLDGSEPAPADLPETAELAESVRETLRELPEDYEAILTAKYLDGESVDEIAGQQSSTPMAVRSKLARARDAFRQTFTRLTGTSTSDAEARHARP